MGALTPYRRRVSDAAVVDVDDVDTWPADLRLHVDSWCEHLRGSTEYGSDLDLSWDDEVECREVLREHLLLAYHFTRLLDVEVERVRKAEGLLPLTRELVERRIDDALAGGHVTPEEAERMRATHVFRVDGGSGRRDQVCLALGNQPLRTGRGVRELLGMWGGEALYAPTNELRPLLKRLGRPAVVVVGLDLTVPGQHNVRPGVLKTFVATRLQLKNSGADVMYRGRVPGAAVLGVWQPGSPAYDRFDRLPRA